MPLPKEVLEVIASNIEQAQLTVDDLEDIVRDARLSGMDVSRWEKEIDDIKTRIRQQKIFYERQRVKSEGRV